MRTTLDLDPAVLSAARAKARADGTSIGTALSTLALAGLRAPQHVPAADGGFPVLRGTPRHAITDELVTEHRDD